MKTETGSYHFTITGKFLTKFLRDIAVDDLVKAIDIGINDIGLTYQQSFNVCTGYLKLCGIDTLHLDDDDAWLLNGKTYNEKLDINVVELMPLEKNPFKI